jgi:hypothetical protein
MTTTAGIRSQEETELWIKAYQGEVLGEAYFAALADRTDDPDHKAKLLALVALERDTKELLAPSLRRLGLSTDPDQSTLAFVSGMTDFDYSAMLDSVPAFAAEFLLSYGRLRELCAPEDGEVVNLLIAHELALEVFMRREKVGLVDTSLQAIAVLPHVTL